MRSHYATGRARLELHRDQALQVVGEPTYRVWRLFLPGSANGFAEGALNVYQVLLLKPNDGRSGLPLTRADWYRGRYPGE